MFRVLPEFQLTCNCSWAGSQRMTVPSSPGRRRVSGSSVATRATRSLPVGGAGHDRGSSSPFAARQASHPLTGGRARVDVFKVQVLTEPGQQGLLRGQVRGGGQGLAGAGVGELGPGFHLIGQGGIGEQGEQLRGGVSVHVRVEGGGVPGGDLGHVIVDDLPQVLVHRRVCLFFCCICRGAGAAVRSASWPASASASANRAVPAGRRRRCHPGRFPAVPAGRCRRPG